MTSPTRGAELTIDDILRLKKPNQVTVEIVLDSSLVRQITEKVREIQASVGRFSSLASKSEAKLSQELEELIGLAKESIVSFVFQDIGKRSYDALVMAHPPTPEQKKMWKDEGQPGNLAYNIESFPPALISACSMEPKISLEQALEIFDNWSEGDVSLLFNGALAACLETTSIPLSRLATGQTTNTLSSLTTAMEQQESPDLSSLDGS